MSKTLAIIVLFTITLAGQAFAESTTAIFDVPVYRCQNGNMVAGGGSACEVLAFISGTDFPDAVPLYLVGGKLVKKAVGTPLGYAWGKPVKEEFWQELGDNANSYGVTLACGVKIEPGQDPYAVYL